MEVDDDFDEPACSTGAEDFVSSTNTYASRGTKVSRVTKVSRATRNSKGRPEDYGPRPISVGEKIGFLDKAAMHERHQTEVDDFMLGSYTVKAGTWHDKYQSQMLSSKDIAYRLPV